MATIIGYAYESDLHCISCALKRFPNILEIDARDNRGNDVTPYYTFMEHLDENGNELPAFCGDCLEVLE